jgi:hypothetical protein
MHGDSIRGLLPFHFEVTLANPTLIPLVGFLVLCHHRHHKLTSVLKITPHRALVPFVSFSAGDV